MDYVILSLIVFLIKCNAGELSTTDNPHIIFTRLSSSKQEHAVCYTVVKNRPLVLQFQNMSVTRGWCFDYNNHEKYLDIGTPNTITDSRINFKSVGYGMSVLWKCNVSDTKDDDSLNLARQYHVFYLNLHVKGAKSVDLTVNGKKITFSEVDLSVPYDGETIFYYEDGDHVEIVCRNRYSTGAVHLEYSTKGATNVSGSAMISIQLHSESELNSHIDCVYVTIKPADKFVYRVTFTKKQLIYFNENKTLSHFDVATSANRNKDVMSGSLILGSSVGAVLVILGVAGVACWYVRTRTVKRIENPQLDFTNHTPQSICEHQHDACGGDHLSGREIHYDIPEGIENTEPIYNFYTEINYYTCKPKIGEAQTRNSYVYDEPYVQITMREKIQTSPRVIKYQ